MYESEDKGESTDCRPRNDFSDKITQKVWMHTQAGQFTASQGLFVGMSGLWEKDELSRSSSSMCGCFRGTLFVSLLPVALVTTRRTLPRTHAALRHITPPQLRHLSFIHLRTPCSHYVFLVKLTRLCIARHSYRSISSLRSPNEG